MERITARELATMFDHRYTTSIEFMGGGQATMYVWAATLGYTDLEDLMGTGNPVVAIGGGRWDHKDRNASWFPVSAAWVQLVTTSYGEDDQPVDGAGNYADSFATDTDIIGAVEYALDTDGTVTITGDELVELMACGETANGIVEHTGGGTATAYFPLNAGHTLVVGPGLYYSPTHSTFNTGELFAGIEDVDGDPLDDPRGGQWSVNLTYDGGHVISFGDVVGMLGALAERWNDSH